MSFSKAKLQRFNEIQDCSPSPAKYHVAETHSKFIRCGLFTKSGKFSRKGSPPASDAGSTKSTPCFQTPTALPKKKKILSMHLSKKSQEHELLKEKIVECNNKDAFIRELTEELENLKTKISNLDQEYNTLKSENETNKADSENLRLDYKKQLNNLTVKCKKVEGTADELSKIRKDYQYMKTQNQEDIEDMLKNLNTFQVLYNEAVQANQQLIESKDKQRQTEIEQLQEQYAKELKLWEEQFQKQQDLLKKTEDEVKDLKISHTKEITLLRQKYQEESEIILNEIQDIENKKNDEINQLQIQLSQKDAKIILLQENFKEVDLLHDIQTKEKCDEIEEMWKSKLEEQQKESDAILKECQEISEYNIIQSEIEKNNLKKLLAEIQVDYDPLKLRNEELTEKLKNYTMDLNNAEREIANLKSQQRAFEITINTNLETIEVLKKRLISSDHDVEQFKEELQNCEAKLLNYENKYSELLILLEEIQNEKEELEMQFESTIKITEAEVQKTMKSLIYKVDNYDEIVKNQIMNNEKDQKLFNEVYSQLQQQQSLNNQAQIVIDESKNILEDLELDNNNLQIRNEELKNEIEIYKNQIMLYTTDVEEAAEIRKKYIETSGRYDEILQKHEQLMLELENIKYEKTKAELRYAEMRNKMEQLYSQIQTFDIELEALEIKNSCLELENKELNQKYVEMVENLNNKQKSKQISEHYGELYKHNIDLQSENTNLVKVVDRLNKEIYEMKKTKKTKWVEDKENIASPTRLINRTADSPGPLKEKN